MMVYTCRECGEVVTLRGDDNLDGDDSEDDDA
jgi:hypothetical protein